MDKLVLGLMGAKRSGKTTVANLLAERGFAILEPGRQVMAMVARLDPIVDGHTRVSDVYRGPEDYEKFKDIPEGRRLLQAFGTDVMREVDPDFWALQQSKFITESDISVVSTAVRFPNEARMIRGWGGYVIEVTRDDLVSDDEHASETAWREVEPDYVILNNGTLSDLADTVSELLVGLGAKTH